MNKSKVAPIGYGIVFLAGIYLVFCGLTANSEIQGIIANAVHSYFDGKQTAGFGNVIAGLLAGGHLAMVPMWQIRIALVLGWLLISVAIIGVRCWKEDRSIRDVFRRGYWTNLE